VNNPQPSRISEGWLRNFAEPAWSGMGASMRVDDLAGLECGLVQREDKTHPPQCGADW